jgi:hypothetical protein
MKPPLHTDLMQQFDPAMLGSIEHAYSKANGFWSWAPKGTKRNVTGCEGRPLSAGIHTQPA